MNAYAARKPLYWCGSSYKDYLTFPAAVQDDGGYQLDRIQQGLDPLDFAPAPAIGAGVYKIRVRDGGDTYRVLYLANFDEAVYVLHCYKKKSTQGIATPRKDVIRAKRRYKNVIAARPAQAR